MRTKGLSNGMAGILATLLAGLLGAGCDGSRSGIDPTGAADTTSQGVGGFQDSTFLGIPSDSSFQTRIVRIDAIAGRTYHLQVRDLPTDPGGCRITVRDSVGNQWPSFIRIQDDPTGEIRTRTGCTVDFPARRPGRYFVEVHLHKQVQAWLSIRTTMGMDDRIVEIDSHEWNNSLRSPAPIEESQPVDGTLYGYDVDNFRFVAPRAGIYAVAFQEDSSLRRVDVLALRSDSSIQYPAYREGENDFVFAALRGDTVILHLQPDITLPGRDSSAYYGIRYRFQVRWIDDPPPAAVDRDQGESTDLNGFREIHDDQVKHHASLHGIGTSGDVDRYRINIEKYRDYTILVESKWPTVEMSIQNLDLTLTSWPAIAHMGDSLQVYTFRTFGDGTLRFTLHGTPTKYAISASSQLTSLR